MDKLTRWLRRSTLALGLLVAPLFGVAGELEPLTLRDFSAGLATHDDSSVICDECAQDVLNVDVESKSIVKRRGSVKQNSTTLGSLTGYPTRFLHEFADTGGSFWLLSLSSSTLYKSNDGGATNSVLTSTHGVTVNSRFCGVNAFGYARLTDGTTNWILYNGTNVSISTASPKGPTCEFFAERIWTSVGSLLYASANGDPEDWVVDETTDDDSFFAYIRQNDGYSIRAIKRFKSGLLVLKDYSTDLLLLNGDGLTFTVVPVSNRVGTQYPYSVVERENDVIWLAHDGYYSYDGSTIRRISDPIETTFFNIKQLASGSRSYTEDSAASFALGTHSQTSSTIEPGEVQLSTWSDVDTTSADFAAGTLVNTTTSSVADAVVFPVFYNLGFEGGTGDVAYGYDAGNGITGETNTGRSSLYGARTGTYACRVDLQVDSSAPYIPPTTFTYSVSVLSSTGGVLATTSYVSPTLGSGWAQTSLDLSAYSGQLIKLKFTGGVTPNFYTQNEDTFLSNGSTVTWYHGTFYYTTSASSDTSVALIDDFGGAAIFSTGTFRSATFDSALTNPAWLPSTPTITTNGQTVTLQTESSTDGISWDSPVSWTSGSAPASAQKRYIRATVSFSTSTDAAAVDQPIMTDLTLAARAASGLYLSAAINTGSGTSWNPFVGNSDLSEGGSLTFVIYVDTNSSITPSDATTFVSSQTITNGAIPTVTINSFAFVGSTFTITASTQVPALLDFTLSWNEGSSNFPVWSTYHQGSYISAVAISSDTGNDRMLVYDKNGAWTMYSFPAYTLARYRNKPYFGSNLQGDIVRFQADGIYNDYDGSAINSYWVSKDFDFGYPLTDKTITRYYVTANYRALSDCVFEWGVNRGTLTSESPMGLLDLDLTSGFFRKSIVPSSLTYKRGITHRFKVSDSDLSDQFDILSITIRPDLETAP